MPRCTSEQDIVDIHANKADIRTEPPHNLRWQMINVKNDLTFPI